MSLFKRLAALICVCFLAASAAAQQDATVSGAIGKRLDEYFTSIAASGFSGVLLVAKDRRVLLSKGYGLANKKEQVPFTNKSVFFIGSINKQFTAAAILKLEMQGKLRLTDPISKHIGQVPPDKATITVHDLLTHTAGFANNFGQDDYAPLRRARFIELALNSKLKFTPGEGFNYSNIGYGLLGAIIELVTHEPYERYLYDNLFKPAGMTNTGYMIPKWDRGQVAWGYMRFGFPWGSPLDKPSDADGPYWNLRASAGLLSTVGDLYKWHLALAGNKILSRKAKEKFFTPHVVEHHYGYGWVFSKTPRGTRVIWHDGSNKVFQAHLRRYVDEGVVVIIATNNEQHSADDQIARLEELIFGKD